jgi:peptidoglycan lytic transglycosylase D
VAAYNAGEGTVQKLLTRHKAHTFDEIATRLPAETQLYVPKVEATILRREGLKLNQLRPS